jgi:hypothetical protein
VRDGDDDYWDRRPPAPLDGRWHGFGEMPGLVCAAAALLWINALSSLVLNVLLPPASGAAAIRAWFVTVALILLTINFHRRRSWARTILLLLLVIALAVSAVAVVLALREGSGLDAQGVTPAVGVLFSAALVWLLLRPACRAWCPAPG